MTRTDERARPPRARGSRAHAAHGGRRVDLAPRARGAADPEDLHAGRRGGFTPAGARRDSTLACSIAFPRVHTRTRGREDREAPELGALALLGCRDCSARKDIVELEFQSLKQRRYQGVPRTERAG